MLHFGISGIHGLIVSWQGCQNTEMRKPLLNCLFEKADDEWIRATNRHPFTCRTDRCVLRRKFIRRPSAYPTDQNRLLKIMKNKIALNDLSMQVTFY